MDMGWATIYTALSMMTLRYAWDTKARWLAVGLVIECVVTNLLGAIAPPESSPAINVILELGMMILASFMIVACPRLAISMIVISTLSCVLGLAYSAHADPDMLHYYEERANALFALKCITVLLSGIWDVVVYSVRRFFHWRDLRRRAVDAERRARTRYRS